MKKENITTDNMKDASKENDFKSKGLREAPGETDQAPLHLTFLVITL